MTHVGSTTPLLAIVLVGSVAGVVMASSTTPPPPCLLHQARAEERPQPFLPWWEAAVATNQLSEARGTAGPAAGKLLDHSRGRRVKRQDEVVLPTPTNLRVTTVGRDFINLEWQYDGGERDIVFLVNVYYEGGRFAKDQDTQGRSLRVEGLAPGTAYQLSVQAFQPLPNGRRAYSHDSSRVSATTREAVLPTPTNLRVTSVHRDSIDLAWQYDGGERDIVFLVNVYYEGGRFAKDQDTQGRSLRVEGLAPGTAYQLSVQAFQPLPNGRRAYSHDSSRVSATTRVTSGPQPTRRPVTTAPPPTRATTLPPPPPTDIINNGSNPPLALGCGEGQCACPPPHQLICVPCASLNTCHQIGVEAVCSTEPAAKDVKMSVNVFSCGLQPILNVAGIIRNNGGVQCGSSAGVPAQTVAMVECWGSATLLVQCHADGTWHPYDQHQTHAPSTRNLCQFDTINSPVCGRRPVHQRPADLSSVGRMEPHWPWLAGVFRQGRFACTATIIAPHYLLTAAHCLTSTQETSQETVDPRELRVQHLNTQGKVVKEFVSKVYAYPGFVAGSRPSHDVALVRLEKPVVFSYHVYPACLHTHGLPAHTIAATFNRSSSDYLWQLFLQRQEPRCHAPHDPCAASINLQQDQFCAVQTGFEGYLEEGSSGGPYLVNEGSQAEERWVVAGLVSTSYRHASCDKPVTICAFVADFWPWISRCVHEANCS